MLPAGRGIEHNQPLPPVAMHARVRIPGPWIVEAASGSGPGTLPDARKDGSVRPSSLAHERQRPPLCTKRRALIPNGTPHDATGPVEILHGSDSAENHRSAPCGPCVQRQCLSARTPPGGLTKASVRSTPRPDHHVHGCDDTAYHRQCQRQRDPIPRHDQEPNLQRQQHQTRQQAPEDHPVPHARTMPVLAPRKPAVPPRCDGRDPVRLGRRPRPAVLLRLRSDAGISLPLLLLAAAASAALPPRARPGTALAADRLPGERATSTAWIP